MRKIITAVLLLLLASPAMAVDGNNLLLQVDRNLNPDSYESYKKLINIEPNGKEKEFILFTVKKGKDKGDRHVPLTCKREGEKHSPAG